MITIITKIEIGDSEGLSFTDVGHTVDTNLVSEINQGYDSTLGAFIESNRNDLELGNITIDSFFNTNPFVYEARTNVDTVEGLSISEIININEL